LGQEHPFVLVGHSFGGIVIESLVIEIHRISQQQPYDNLGKRGVENANVFLKNMVGVAFYAVPHAGSRQLIEYICGQCEINLDSKQLAKVLENIDPSISKAADLSNDFSNILSSCTNVYGVYVFIETQPIDDNVVSDEQCQLCNGWLVFKDYCIKTQIGLEKFGFAGYDCRIWSSPNSKT
jgi:hypothetical protein